MQKLLSPEEIAAQTGQQMPFLRLPQREQLFSARAARLRQLAPGHAMADYLTFIARLADQQQRMIDDMPPLPLPDDAYLQKCRAHSMPVLNPQSLPRDRVWCDMLRRMLRRLADDTPPGKLREVMTALERERDELYEAQASKLLAGIAFGLDAGYAPFIAAVLQVYWVHLVTAMGVQAFPRLDVPNVCPCCGQRPVASVARLGAFESGYRYLHCSLCAAEWHMVRIKCAACDSTTGIHYQSIANDRPGTEHAVKAECCDECGSYLKMMYQDRDPNIDPVADDLASLALDLLVSDALGKVGYGVNLMLIHGPDDAGDG